MSSLLIKNGTVVTDTTAIEADIWIADGKVKEIARDIQPQDPPQEIIDAQGLYLFPGGIDVHVHMELPVANEQYSCDDFYSGSKAAIAGGTTTIIDFVTPRPGESLTKAARERKKQAAKSMCDYGLHMSVTHWHPGIPGELKQCRAQGMTSVKLYMAYKQGIGLEDSHILTVMDHAAQLGMQVLVHCEHDETIQYLSRKFVAQGNTSPGYHALSRPPAVEGEAVKRALLMAKMTRCPIYIVHVSTMDAIEEIRKARATGQIVFAETCPHYLLLDEQEYRRPGFESAVYIMSPPLRHPVHKHALWQAIKEGAIQTIATDHCPFNKNQKALGAHDFTKIPNGVAGVEHRLELLYSYGVTKNNISLQQFVSLTATEPAKIFGLYPRKGALQVGSDADILVWDPEARKTISASLQVQRCDSTIYEGFAIKGKPHMVILNGIIAYREEMFTKNEVTGRYLNRKGF